MTEQPGDGAAPGGSTLEEPADIADDGPVVLAGHHHALADAGVAPSWDRYCPPFWT